MFRGYILVVFLFAFFFSFSQVVLAECEISMGMVLADSAGVERENFRKPPVIQNHLEHIVFITVASCPAKKGQEGYINFGDSKEWFKCPSRPPGWGAPSCVVNHTWKINWESKLKKVKIKYKNGNLKTSWVVPVYTVVFDKKKLTKKQPKFVIDDYGMKGHSFSNNSPYSLSRINFNKDSIWEKFKNSKVKLVINRRNYPIIFCGKYKKQKYCIFDVGDEPKPAYWEKGKKVIIALTGLPKIEKNEYFWMRIGVFKFINPSVLIPRKW